MHVLGFPTRAACSNTHTHAHTPLGRTHYTTVSKQRSNATGKTTGQQAPFVTETVDLSTQWLPRCTHAYLQRLVSSGERHKRRFSRRRRARHRCLVQVADARHRCLVQVAGQRHRCLVQVADQRHRCLVQVAHQRRWCQHHVNNVVYTGAVRCEDARRTGPNTQPRRPSRSEERLHTARACPGEHACGVDSGSRVCRSGSNEAWCHSLLPI